MNDNALPDERRRPRLTAAQRDFANRANHALRGDIHSLRQALEAARRRLAQPGKRLNADPLADLEYALERVERRMRDLALLTLADAGALTINQLPCQLNTLIADATLAAQPMATRFDVTLIADVRESDGVEVFVDRALIAQALAALLDNAIRFSPEEESVTVSARISGDCAHITISDHGPGFAQGAEKQVFTPFKPGATQASGASGRLGLGLAVAQAIAHGHRARLIIQPGVSGAIVALELPLAPISRLWSS